MKPGDYYITLDAIWQYIGKCKDHPEIMNFPKFSKCCERIQTNDKAYFTKHVKMLPYTPTWSDFGQDIYWDESDQTPMTEEEIMEHL